MPNLQAPAGLSVERLAGRRELLGSLDAILDHALAQGNIIISLGKDNTEEDMDYVIETFAKIYAMLKPNQQANAPQAFAIMAGMFQPSPARGGGGRGTRGGGGQ